MSSGGFKVGNLGSSGGFKPSSGGFKPAGGSNGPAVIRSGNLGGINLGNSGIKTMPKNTGIVPPHLSNKIGTKIGTIGNSNNGNKSGVGIKIPGLGTVGSNNSNSNGPKVISGNNGNKPKLGLGISIGDIVGNKGPGSGNGPGNGNGNGKGNGNHHHNHHNHHHHGFCFTLPVCQPNYCPPPCPPVIYYPQPYPVGVPVPVPVADPMVVVVNNEVNVDAAKPADAAGQAPVETSKPVTEPTSTETKPADSKPAELTEVVSTTNLPKIPVGATLTLQGKDLADREGQVVLQLGDFAVPATIKEWSNTSVTCTLPALGITKASKATLHVLKADGKTASTMDCELVTSLPTSVETPTPTSSSSIDAAKYEQ